MPGSAHVVPVNRPGRAKRYEVRYRRGGRGFKLEHGGSFPRADLARERERLIQGWLAQGLDPKVELAKLAAVPSRRSVAEIAADWLASRLDLADRSIRVYGENVKTIGATPLGRADAYTLTPRGVGDQVAAWVAAGLAPKTIRGYVSVVRQSLDFAEIEPNPARHRSVKLPSQREVELDPPSVEEYLWLLGKLAPKYRRLLLLIEQTALRISEAVELTPEDVLHGHSQIRVRPTATKGKRGTRRGRFVPIDPWALELVLEDLPFMVTGDGLRSAMLDACAAADRRKLTPHKFRHRRVSLWLAQGVTPRELSVRVGHSKTSMTLDVYSHVMPPVEATREAVEGLLRDGPVMGEVSA